MEKQTERKQRSASICVTMCDRLVLLVLPLADLVGQRCGRTEGGQLLSPFITGLDQAGFEISGILLMA